MSAKQAANIPAALSEARRQLDHWRSQQPTQRTRLPQALWRKAVALAQEHGLNKTARALNVKYDSLRKHLHQAGAAEASFIKPQPGFIELLPDTVTPGGVECMIEWAEGHNATVRMHIKAAVLACFRIASNALRSSSIRSGRSGPAGLFDVRWAERGCRRRRLLLFLRILRRALMVHLTTLRGTTVITNKYIIEQKQVSASNFQETVHMDTSLFSYGFPSTRRQGGTPRAAAGLPPDSRTVSSWA